MLPPAVPASDIMLAKTSPNTDSLLLISAPTAEDLACGGRSQCTSHSPLHPFHTEHLSSTHGQVTLNVPPCTLSMAMVHKLHLLHSISIYDNRAKISPKVPMSVLQCRSSIDAHGSTAKCVQCSQLVQPCLLTLSFPKFNTQRKQASVLFKKEKKCAYLML